MYYKHESYKGSGINENVELDLSNYDANADLKGATGIETSIEAAKTDLACLKTKVDNLGVDKLKTVPAGLSKLSIT